jgi:hypothetical protein
VPVRVIYPPGVFSPPEPQENSSAGPRVAALNVKGQTIHSFFKFKPNINLGLVRRLRAAQEEGTIYQKLEALVIDEISMERADLLDCVDKFLRLNGPSPDHPFGGLQMVFIGDLYTASSVNYRGREDRLPFSLQHSLLFTAHRVFESLKWSFWSWRRSTASTTLIFIDLLNAIRNRSIDSAGLEKLNRRYQPDFEPPAADRYIYLTTTNEMPPV